VDAVENLAPALEICQLGQREYQPVWRAMQAFTDQRTDATADQIWVVEHPPVFTLGQAGSMDHVLMAGDIPVVKVDRGGQVTYHGPGQLVVYPLLDLRRLGLGIKALVNLLEQAVIDLLSSHGIQAKRRDGAPGVYVDERKIAALGLRVRRSCTFHGLSFNIAMDLEPFARINPCGYAGLEVTQLSALGVATDLDRVAEMLIGRIAGLLGVETRPVRPEIGAQLS
jgi:lipoyl(octanoyl) transferase